MVLCNSLPTGTTGERIRLGYNSIDTGSNYANRASKAGATDVTSTSETSYDINEGLTPDLPTFDVTYIANLSGKEKLMVNHHTYESTAGAGTAPYRIESVGKWANTSNPLNIFNKTNVEAGSFNTGSEAVILGWDPDDTHTTNFWEELDSTTTTTSGTIQSGTFTAKKYLMYQIVGKKASGSGTGSPRFQFNGDTGSNYAQRNSINGTDYTYANQTSANIGGDGNTAGEMAMFIGFIINNAGTEKLFIGHSAFGNTAGAGQIGNRGEIACKWANTSAQITSIHCMNLNFDAGAIMKIWGSD
jgi:hypothetical protein